MSIQLLQESVKRVIQYYTDKPKKAIADDTAATAVLVEGLRCKATGPNGWEVFSDMAKGIGGNKSARTPGWLMRAALANCEVTMITLRAAELGIELSPLEVLVGGVSDNRGMLQMEDSIPAGPLGNWMKIKIGEKDVADETLWEIVHWTKKHVPVGDAISRAIPIEVEVEVVKKTGRPVMGDFLIGGADKTIEKRG